MFGVKKISQFVIKRVPSKSIKAVGTVSCYLYKRSVPYKSIEMRKLTLPTIDLIYGCTRPSR